MYNILKDDFREVIINGDEVLFIDTYETSEIIKKTKTKVNNYFIIIVFKTLGKDATTLRFSNNENRLEAFNKIKSILNVGE